MGRETRIRHASGRALRRGDAWEREFRQCAGPVSPSGAGRRCHCHPVDPLPLLIVAPPGGTGAFIQSGQQPRSGGQSGQCSHLQEVRGCGGRGIRFGAGGWRRGRYRDIGEPVQQTFDGGARAWTAGLDEQRFQRRLGGGFAHPAILSATRPSRIRVLAGERRRRMQERKGRRGARRTDAGRTDTGRRRTTKRRTTDARRTDARRTQNRHGPECRIRTHRGRTGTVQAGERSRRTGR